MNVSSAVNLPECYRILKVAPGAPWSKIRRSYRELALRCHPDHNPENCQAEEEFKNLVRAFETLHQHYETRQWLESNGSDPDNGLFSPHKAFWSFFWRDSKGGNGGSKPPVENATPYSPGETFSGENNAFEAKGWKSWSLKAWHSLRCLERKWMMLDVEMPVTLDPSVAEGGGGIRIRRGMESFEVRVPPQSQNGSLLRVPGKGDAGVFHRERGDLWIRIQVRAQRSSEAGIEDCFYQVKLDPEAIRNRQVFTLETSQGPIPYSLPLNTRHGQTFVLYGKKKTASGRRSRHLVTISLA